MLLLTIGLGGMAGAYARYRLSGWIHARTGPDFPWGTLSVNVSGSFLLGLLLPLVADSSVPPTVHAFITVGCLGAFTTFSTFAYEALMLVQQRQRMRAGAYVAASLGLGLLGIVTGMLLGQWLF